jgi:hypothetical protein
MVSTIVGVSQSRFGDILASLRKVQAMRRAGWAVVVILLVLAPVLDLSWNEPMLDGGQHTHCQLHATPGMALEPACIVVTFAVELLLPPKLLDRLPLVGSSIDIPPRL